MIAVVLSKRVVLAILNKVLTSTTNNLIQPDVIGTTTKPVSVSVYLHTCACTCVIQKTLPTGAYRVQSVLASVQAKVCRWTKTRCSVDVAWYHECTLYTLYLASGTTWRAPGKPRDLHTTIASSRVQWSSHIVPHSLL